MATEEITISELELADEVLADMTLPVDTATETRAVTLKQLRAWLGSALPVGSVFASVGRLDDERFTLLDGKTISRIGTYEAFCNKVIEKVQAGTWKACTEEEFNLEVSETGQCGKFVVSNDYVRIPKLGNSLCSGVIDGTIPVVGNGTALGLTNGTINAGMANAPTQGIDAYSGNYGNPVGIANSGSTLQGTSASKSVGVTTDPTKSGIEAKINSVEVFYYMVISTERQTASVEIDINKVYEDLNLKANGDLSNVTSVAQSFKTASVSWGIPDYSAAVNISSVVPKNTSSSYTIPFDGWFIFNHQNYGSFKGVLINGVQITVGETYGTAWASFGNSQILVKKGDIVTVSATVVKAVAYMIPFTGVN